MIKAYEAKQNVINKQIQDYHKVKETVDQIIEVISETIQFYSQQGLNSLIYVPYNHSQFSSIKLKQIAQTLFDKILKENGYIVKINDCVNNILEIEW